MCILHPHQTQQRVKKVYSYTHISLMPVTSKLVFALDPEEFINLLFDKLLKMDPLIRLRYDFVFFNFVFFKIYQYISPR